MPTRTKRLPDGTLLRVNFYGKRGSGPHRHKFTTNGETRRCELCGARQTKVKGRWKDGT